MDNALGNGCRAITATGAYGGMWTANIVSGIARDLLGERDARLEAAGYPVVLHVHDEIVCRAARADGSID